MPSRNRNRRNRNPNDTILGRFNQEARSRGLQPGSQAYWDERREFVTQSVLAGFNAHFGSNENKLEGWKGLCEVIGVVDDGSNLTSILQCKKVNNVQFLFLEFPWFNRLYSTGIERHLRQYCGFSRRGIEAKDTRDHIRLQRRASCIYVR